MAEVSGKAVIFYMYQELDAFPRWSLEAPNEKEAQAVFNGELECYRFLVNADRSVRVDRYDPDVMAKEDFHKVLIEEVVLLPVNQV